MATSVEAHITGVIFKIETRVGAQVRAGEVLVILESMKMETPIEAPRPGRVSQILVEEGQSVEEGDVVVLLD